MLYSAIGSFPLFLKIIHSSSAEVRSMESFSGGAWWPECSNRRGVETVFAIADGTYLALIAAFKELGIKLITPRHETTAAHMAGAFARLSGGLGSAWPATARGWPTPCPGWRWKTPRATGCCSSPVLRRPPVRPIPDRGGDLSVLRTRWGSSGPCPSGRHTAGSF